MATQVGMKLEEKVDNEKNALRHCCGTCRYWEPTELGLGETLQRTKEQLHIQGGLINEPVGICIKEVQVPSSYFKASFIAASEGGTCPFWEPSSPSE